MAWKFFSLTSDRENATSTAPHHGDVTATTPGSASIPAYVADEEAILIARQPIFDATEIVRGYELLMRDDGTMPASAPGTPKDSARLVVDSINRFGAAQALGDKTGYLFFADDSLASDLVNLLPKERFVLEFPYSFLQKPEQRSRCANLLSQGYKLACVCEPGQTDLEYVSGNATMVVYDLAVHTLQDIVRIDRSIKGQKIQRLLRNVNKRDDFDSGRTFCFNLYQGQLFAQPETMAMNRLDPSRMRVLEIFNLVVNRADIGLIEDAFKHDVALCYSLLCYINSVGIGLQYRVGSIRDAIMLLGYDFLWRWLSVLLFAGVDLTAAQRVLLNTAVIRGRLAELLGHSNLPAKEGNALFIVGIFSMLEPLLGVPIREAVQKLQLPEEVTAAVVSREGKYAPYLELALAFESNNLATAQRLCRELDIDLSKASQAHLAAIEWAGVLSK